MTLPEKIEALHKAADAIRRERDRAIEKYGECGGQTGDTGRYLKLRDAVDELPDAADVRELCEAALRVADERDEQYDNASEARLRADLKKAGYGK